MKDETQGKLAGAINEAWRDGPMCISKEQHGKDEAGWKKFGLDWVEK